MYPYNLSEMSPIPDLNEEWKRFLEEEDMELFAQNISFEFALKQALDMLNISLTDGNNSCPLSEPISLLRFFTVAVLGTVFASVSTLENLFIFCLLLSKAKYRESHSVYLIFLALCDFLLSFIYFPLVSVDRLKEYFIGLTGLARLWLVYFSPVLMVAHVLKTFSGFLILVATLERFLITNCKRRSAWIKRHRLLLVALSFLIAVLLKGPVVFEITLTWRANCPLESMGYDIELSNLTRQKWYGTGYRFYVRNIGSVFLPFALLAYFNLAIVCALRKRERKASLFRIQSKHHRVQARSATTMMLLVVCTYLGSNVLNVVLTAWEHIDIESLMLNYRSFYSISSDLVSILSIIACAVRVPIYLAYDSELRLVAKECCCCCIENRRRQSLKPNSSTRQGGSACDFDRLAMLIALDFRPPDEQKMLENEQSQNQSDEEEEEETPQ